MRLSVHPEAARELSEAVRYHDSQRQGLGSQFFAEGDAAVDRISDAPGGFHQLARGVRRFRLTRFPYSIVYRVKENNTRVVAFSHHSRRPDYWRDRLVD